MKADPIRFLSVCSGLEGASLAVEPLGWMPVGFSEIEAFPSAIRENVPIDSLMVLVSAP